MKRFAHEYVVSEADAENILQDVFMSLWEKRDLILIHENPVAFLYTAIRNRCIDFLRRKMLEQDISNYIQEEYALTIKMNLDSLTAIDEHLFYKDDIECKVNQAINSLPAKCREIFMMNKIEGKKQKQIAEELNITINTVETQMGIAYKKLKDSLKDLYPLLLLFLN